MIRIGIPRGLLYYHYFPMWKAFFEELKAQVVVSQPTTTEMVNLGCSRVIGDVCLPIKVYCGHVASLKDKCDYIFIPAIHSVRYKLYNCPKLIGLPDLVRAAVPECPPILDPDIDINKGEKLFYTTVYQLGSLFTDVQLNIDSALVKAKEADQTYNKYMQRCGLSCPQAIAEMYPEFIDDNGHKNNNLTENHSFNSVGLIGHRYLLYDQHMNYQLFHLLRRICVNPVTADTVPIETLQGMMTDLVEKPYWGCEEEIIGGGAYYLRSKVAGIISVVAFGCGPDSMMIELLRRRAKRLNKPFINLVLDEHNSEGGLITRLEAFIDMVRRSQRQPNKQVAIIHRNGVQSDRINTLGTLNMGAIAPSVRESAKILGVNLIVPPVTKQTISLGVRYSPEYACLPFKAILGTFIECLEQGADTLFMVTSSNACRMGYYSKVYEEILHDLGYKFKFLRHMSSDNSLAGVLRTIRRGTNYAPWYKVIKAYSLATSKLKALDNLERNAAKVRGVELQKGQTDFIYQAGIKAIDKTTNLYTLKKVVISYQQKLNRVPIDHSVVPLRVGIIGELYVVVEPYVNLNLEVELGKLGVEVKRNRTSYLSEWTNFRAYMGALNNEKKKLARYAYPYLRRDVGGHGLESVAEKVRLAQEGYDGIVHVMPFTCMPETIAQNIMTLTEENIPVLTVLCDEQETEAGLLTRLEAFVDLMDYRRQGGRSKIARL